MNSIRFLLSAVSVKQFPRSPLPEVAFSGRSNVGKSSLLNLTVGRKGVAKVSRTPGKTRAINFFEVDGSWRLVDLPGYGYARLSKTETKKWGRLIDQYLRDRKSLSGIVQLIDSRHDPTDRDLEMMDWLAEAEMPTVIALTKVDKLNKNERRTVVDRFKKEWLGGLDWPIVATSAEKREGRKELLAEVMKVVGLRKID